ncbi:MAG TPA: sugar phosphate isomerase/epimerase family protein [Opitutus sp.]|nr:sugar phosphate isomerase/epimerase family protein [Opitutus sp.]
MTLQTSRRTFLKSASLLSIAGLTGIPGLNLAQAAIAPVPRVGGPRLKLSLNAYSFARLLNNHLMKRGEGLSLLDLCEFCARHNFDGIDATGYYFPGYRDRRIPDDRFVFEVKRKAFDLGLGISGTGVGNNFTIADPAARAKDVAWIKAWVEVAAKLGAPVLRVFADTQMRNADWKVASNHASRDEVEKYIADSVRECADHAAKFGVIIGVQNHGDFLRTADDMISLLRRVDSPWCGAIVDTGFFRAADPYAEIAKTAPYAVNWQVKQSPLGIEKVTEAPMDLPRLVKIVLASGYRGYLPIETLSPRGSGETYDPYKTVPEFLAQIRAALAAEGHA